MIRYSETPKPVVVHKPAVTVVHKPVVHAPVVHAGKRKPGVYADPDAMRQRRQAEKTVDRGAL